MSVGLNHLRKLFCTNNRNNADLFRQKMIHFGSLNQGKIIYYIEENNENLGFFAMYRAWIEYLYFADVCGYAPVVYGGDRFSYKENGRVHGTVNPFEYYFEQPAAISAYCAKRSSKVIVSDLLHRQMVELIFTGKYGNYKWNKRYMREMGHIVRKYIRFNQPTWKYISEGIQNMNFVTERVLGIHVRGTDFRARYNNHPIYLTEEDCFEAIDSLLEKNLYNKLFIATDDNRILKNFIKRYGEMLCFYKDVERGSRNQSVVFSKSKRKNNKYLLGLEVIRDMYSLSMCTGLVAGISQVVVCAQINKLARSEHYEDLMIIDKGFNMNGHRFKRKGSN